MATNTPKLGLIKPTELTDFVDIDQLNTNMDTIDTKLGSITEDAWTAYVPVWTTSGVAPAIGNGSLSGKFKQIGKTVHFAMALKFGTTTTKGTGSWSFSLPVRAREFFAVPEANAIPGAGAVLRTGVKNYPQAYSNILAVGGLSFAAVADNHAGTLGGITDTFPFAWANTDIYAFAGTYEAF